MPVNIKLQTELFLNMKSACLCVNKQCSLIYYTNSNVWCLWGFSASAISLYEDTLHLQICFIIHLESFSQFNLIKSIVKSETILKLFSTTQNKDFLKFCLRKLWQKYVAFEHYNVLFYWLHFKTLINLLKFYAFIWLPPFLIRNLHSIKNIFVLEN